MAADFVGLTVLVKLKSTPDVPLQGLVSNVQDQSLFLYDVVFPSTGVRMPKIKVHGSDIADVEVAPTLSKPQSLTPVQIPSSQVEPFQRPSKLNIESPVTATQPSLRSETSLLKQIPSLRPPQLPPLSQKGFLDPAILSYNRIPKQPKPILPLISNNGAIQYVATPQESSKGDSHLFDTHPSTREVVQELSAQDTTPTYSSDKMPNMTATLTTPFNALRFDEKMDVSASESYPENVASDHTESMQSNELSGNLPKNRRGRRRKFGHIQDRSYAEPEHPLPEEIRESPPASGNHNLAGRQSILIERQYPLRSEPDNQQFKSSSRQRNRRRNQSHHHAVQGGWATEDATDVQEMGDFDFEGNLSKFDKRAVFAQLRGEDATADEDRLKSFNRLKKPGTFGGKNLHPTENVLDDESGSSRLASDSDDDLWNGSVSSKKMERPSRTNSIRPGGLPRVSSALSDRVLGLESQSLNHSTRSQLKQSQHPLTGASLTNGPKPFGRSWPGQYPLRSSSRQHRPRLRYVETDKVCKTLRPDVLQQIEDIAINELKYSEDILSENAGRGIAEIALELLKSSGPYLMQSDRSHQPTVVMLLGDNQAGARALVAARHLQERGVRIIACTAGPVSLTSGSLSQAWQRFGDMLRGWTETAAYLKTLDAPADLIIDALLGRTYSKLDDLQLESSERATLNAGSVASVVRDMIQWANDSSANILSMDLPSDTELITGDSAQRYIGEPDIVKAKLVVCLGAPCSSLLKVLELRAENLEQWRIVVIDIGLNPAAKQYLRTVRGNVAATTSSGKLVQFGSGWSTELRFDSGQRHNSREQGISRR